MLSAGHRHGPGDDASDAGEAGSGAAVTGTSAPAVPGDSAVAGDRHGSAIGPGCPPRAGSGVLALVPHRQVLPGLFARCPDVRI